MIIYYKEYISHLHYNKGQMAEGERKPKAVKRARAGWVPGFRGAGFQKCLALLGMSRAGANSFVNNGSHLLRTRYVPDMVLRGFISITPDKPHGCSVEEEGETASLLQGLEGPGRVLILLMNSGAPG